MELKITERGWAGHFIAGNSCRFRRNTLIECRDRKIVVSTVGNYFDHTGTVQEIGCSRYYETVVFEASYEKPYWEADISKELNFESNWALNYCGRDADKKANEMHDKVVDEFVTNLTNPNPQEELGDDG